MEDSTLQGWTSPVVAPTPVMGEAPTGWRVPGPPPHQGQLGEIRTTPKADDATISYAARHFTRRDADEFEVDGRKWD